MISYSFNKANYPPLSTEPPISAEVQALIEYMREATRRLTHTPVEEHTQARYNRFTEDPLDKEGTALAI